MTDESSADYDVINNEISEAKTELNEFIAQKKQEINDKSRN